MLSQAVNPLENLAMAIIRGVVTVPNNTDPNLEDVIIVDERVIDSWSKSGLNRLTYLECVFIAQEVRKAYNVDSAIDVQWADSLFRLIGEKPNILNKVFNIAVMGIVAFMAYKVIRR